jgi:chromosome segregation ATPase
LAAQLAVQQSDRDCLLAEMQARAEQLQQMDQALAGLENDITVAEKQVGACSAQLEALAQSAQEQLEDCVRRTAETKQSVAEMKHNNERLVQETATQREEWGQASLVLSDVLNGLENTLGQLEASWAEEERRSKHFADVQQPAEEAARALLASICAQEENLVWRAKHHAAESELEALQQEQLSVSTDKYNTISTATI